MRRLSMLLVVLAAVVGCDFSPSSPFGGFNEEGATLTGRFQSSGVAQASQLRAQRALPAASDADSLTVLVLDMDGNEIGSVEVENGSFTLRGLPDAFQLVFVDENGTPVGDPMTFEAVKPNQELDIVVDLVGGEVVLIEEKRTGIDHDEVELEGTAHNIVISGHPMTGSLDVDGYHVLTRAAETSIRKGNRSLTLEDLDEGDRVHVRGVFEDGDVFAYEIKLQDDDDGEPTSQTACTVPDPAKPGHILICHKGRTLSVASEAWPGHQSHGDKCGPCGN